MTRKLTALMLALMLMVGVAFTPTADAQTAPDYSEQCAALTAQQEAIDQQEVDTYAALNAARLQLDTYEALYLPLYDNLIAAYADFPEIQAQYQAQRDAFVATLANARAYYDQAEADFAVRVAAAEASIAAVLTAYNC